MTGLDQMTRAWVLGLGASGLAAARLLRERGIAVAAVDAKAPDPAVRERLDALGAECLAPFTGQFEGTADLAVASPGIRADGPWIRGLRARGVPVLSEVEIGWMCRGRARVLAVTGSNGKSTLAKLCADTLLRAGLRAVPAGNYGLPVCEAVRQGAWDWLVIEVSTFQLETMEAFRPEVGILLNLYPNHLDRHGTLEAYAGLKARLFSRMRAGDTALIHEDADHWLPPPGAGRERRRLFGLTGRAAYRYGAGAVGGPGGGAGVSVRGTPFDNDILGVTAAAAAGAMDAVGVPAATLEAAIAAFEMLPHRMQRVGRIGGVDFVNDSKATNLAALAAALRMTAGPVRLIAGGILKETDLNSIKDLLVKKCKKIYGIGKSSSTLQKQWGEWVPFEDCRVLAEAVRKAWREAMEGETVLLSTGCASFDQFNSYEDRGAQFTCIVKELETEKERL